MGMEGRRDCTPESGRHQTAKETAITARNIGDRITIQGATPLLMVVKVSTVIIQSPLY
jgi:hypothetical protein